MILFWGMAPLQALLAKAPVIPSSLAPFSINLPGASILFLFGTFNIDNSHRHIKKGIPAIGHDLDSFGWLPTSSLFDSNDLMRNGSLNDEILLSRLHPWCPFVPCHLLHWRRSLDCLVYWKILRYKRGWWIHHHGGLRSSSSSSSSPLQFSSLPMFQNQLCWWPFFPPISDVVPRQPGVEGLPLLALVYAPASSNGKTKANGKMQTESWQDKSRIHKTVIWHVVLHHGRQKEELQTCHQPKKNWYTYHQMAWIVCLSARLRSSGENKMWTSMWNTWFKPWYCTWSWGDPSNLITP